MATIKSPVWGGTAQEVTQGFGVNLDNVPDSWYAYAADWGLSYGDHVGIDIGMEKMTPIYTPVDGVVTEAGFSPYYRPNPVTVETPDNPATPDDEAERIVFGHLWEDAVNTGQTVRKGDLIGWSGEQTIEGTMTPDGSGPHLHFERLDISEHVALDPMPLLDGTFTPNGAGSAPAIKIDPGAINRRIEMSEASNGTISPLHGMGQAFVDFGSRYGINPAVVVAFSQRECQLGAANGDAIIPFNNFGGNTCGAVGVTVASGCASAVGRSWSVFATARDGIEAMFQTLNDDLYRKTGGKLADVLEVYAPAFENDHADAFAIFAQVGRDLGADIGPDTNIYAGAKGIQGFSQPGSGGVIDWAGLVDGISTATAKGAQRAGIAVAGLAVGAVGLALVFPAIGNVIPIVRAAKAAKGVVGHATG